MIKCKDCKHWDGIVTRSDQEPRDMLYGYCKLRKFCACFDFSCTRGRRVKKPNGFGEKHHD